MRRTLLVARHGETDWNVANRWQGQSDIPLNDRGRAQAQALASRLRGHDVTGIVSSDLSRARATADILARELGLKVVYEDLDLRERSFGRFEGLTREECECEHPDAWRAWQDHHTMPPGGESSEALLARAQSALERAARELARDDVPALVVTHGGVIRALVSAATGARPPPVRNAEVWRMVWDETIIVAHTLGGEDIEIGPTSFAGQEPPT